MGQNYGNSGIEQSKIFEPNGPVPKPQILHTSIGTSDRNVDKKAISLINLGS